MPWFSIVTLLLFGVYTMVYFLTNFLTTIFWQQFFDDNFFDEIFRQIFLTIFLTNFFDEFRNKFFDEFFDKPFNLLQIASFIFVFSVMKKSVSWRVEATSASCVTHGGSGGENCD